MGIITLINLCFNRCKHFPSLTFCHLSFAWFFSRLFKTFVGNKGFEFRPHRIFSRFHHISIKCSVILRNLWHSPVGIFATSRALWIFTSGFLALRRIMTGVKKEPFQLIFLSIITNIINSFKNLNWQYVNNFNEIN